MTTQFITDLRQVVFTAVGTFNLSDDHVVAHGWDNSAAQVLKLLITEKIIHENELFADIHLRLLSLGRRSFDQHKKNGTYPDHTYSPHALAYAIHTGAFTEEERGGIKYDHGETELDFIQIYNKGDLRKKVLDVLLTEATKLPLMADEDPEFICSH